MAAKSGTRGLFKNHVRGCTNRGKLTRCGCAWRAYYKRYNVALAAWAGKAVDPRELSSARAVLTRLRKAVDDHEFDPTGERPAVAAKDWTLSMLATVYQSQRQDLRRSYAVDDKGKPVGSAAIMLQVVKDSRIGPLALIALVEKPAIIGDWLKATAKDRRWSAATWNRYFELLRALLNYGKREKHVRGDNPMDDITPPVAEQPEQFRQRVMTPENEAALIAACDRLDDRAINKRAKLTQAKADAIRAAVAGGKPGKDVAQRYGVSPAVVSSIVHGDIWNPAAQVKRTQGPEMKRRLFVALDCGARAGEMLQIETTQVAPMRTKGADGNPVRGFVVTLPAAITKGGATTGKPERLFVSSPRLVQVIEQRLFQLRANSHGQRFIFGTEAGRQQLSFEWHRLYRLAGIPAGRALGVVWHTLRHEFSSRLADEGVPDAQRQQLARHKDAKTTALYTHTTDATLFAAAGRIGRP